jgi:hypothetical protein
MAQLRIDAVQRDFQAWRSSTSKRSKIPEDLWGKALQLLERYPINEVSRKLGVSGSQLYARRKQQATKTNALPTKNPVNFMELNIPSMTALYDAHGSGNRLEIKRFDGLVLAMQQLSESVLLQIFNQFMRGI